MAQRDTLAYLQQLNAKGGESQFDILTVYIGAEKAGSLTPKYVLSQFHSLRHSNLSAEQKEIFRPDIERIELYLATHSPGANRSMTIFSAGENLWETMDFDFPLQPFMTVAPQPHLAPIELALQAHQSYLVLLVNKKHARLMSVKMGEVTETMEIDNPEPMADVKLVHNEGLMGGQDKAFRHTQKYLTQFLKQVAKAASEFAARTNASDVVIGGHKEMIGKFKSLLPARLKSRVRGELVALPNMPTTVVLQKTQEVLMTVTTTQVITTQPALA